MNSSRLPSRAVAQVLDALSDPVLVVTSAGTLRFANRAAASAFRVDVGGRTAVPVADLVHPDDRARLVAVLDRVATTGETEPVTVVVRITSGDGWNPWGFRVSGLTGDDAGTTVLVGRPAQPGMGEPATVADDVVGSSASRPSTDAGQALLEHSQALLILLDGEGVITKVSGAVGRLLGTAPERLVGTRLDELVSDHDRRRIGTALRAARRAGQSQLVDASFRHATLPRTVPVEFSLASLADDPVAPGLVFTGHVATTLREARARIENLVDHDPLTGLANRPRLMRELGRVLREPRPSGDCVVLCIGLDRFGGVNDLYGLDVGDRLLVRFVDRLRRATRNAVVLARTAGVEFVAGFDGLVDHAAVEQLVRSVEDAMDEPFTLDGLTTRVSFTVGSVVANREGAPERAVADAINAMVSLKGAKRGQPTPEPTVVDLTVRRSLADQLTAAFQDEQIRTHFQPIHHLPGREVVALEALARWHHPVRGVLQPGEFLPVIEHAGLSTELGALVLHQACRLLRTRHDEPVVVHVNTSPGELNDPRFAAGALATVRSAGVAPQQLCFEVTEHHVARRAWHGTTDVLAENLRELRESGFHVAIDDFGTGVSGLAHLLDLPIDTIKIDQRLVGPVAHDRAYAAVVGAMVKVGADLGCTTIAEGVETAEQLVELHNLGCRYVQGFLLSRPAEITV
jgi:diguanylate cyclase (GGDEF)-like protein/PAS domain S-box-containing protein